MSLIQSMCEPKPGGRHFASGGRQAASSRRSIYQKLGRLRLRRGFKGYVDRIFRVFFGMLNVVRALTKTQPFREKVHKSTADRTSFVRVHF